MANRDSHSQLGARPQFRERGASTFDENASTEVREPTLTRRRIPAGTDSPPIVRGAGDVGNSGIDLVFVDTKFDGAADAAFATDIMPPSDVPAPLPTSNLPAPMEGNRMLTSNLPVPGHAPGPVEGDGAAASFPTPAYGSRATPRHALAPAKLVTPLAREPLTSAPFDDPFSAGALLSPLIAVADLPSLIQAPPQVAVRPHKSRRYALAAAGVLVFIGLLATGVIIRKLQQRKAAHQASGAPQAPSPELPRLSGAAALSGTAELMRTNTAVPIVPAPAQALVSVTFTSQPLGAFVTLLDRGNPIAVGLTPITHLVDRERTYDVVFSLAGRDTQVEKLEPLKATTVAAQLERLGRSSRKGIDPEVKGVLMVSSKPPCDIIINGRPTGLVTPQRDIPLPPGNYKLTLVNAAHNIRRDVEVKVIAGKSVKIIQDYSAQLP